METSTARPKARQNRNTAVRKGARVEKYTIQLDLQTSIKLTIQSQLRGMTRSELVNEILADALGPVVFAVRGQNQVSAIPSASVETPAADQAA